MTISTEIIHAAGIGRRVLCGLGHVSELPHDHSAVDMARFDEDEPLACEQCKRELDRIGAETREGR